MALLVFTDFACWAPIAFFSLTAAFGYDLISLNDAKVRGARTPQTRTHTYTHSNMVRTQTDTHAYAYSHTHTSVLSSALSTMPKCGVHAYLNIRTHTDRHAHKPTPHAPTPRVRPNIAQWKGRKQLQTQTHTHVHTHTSIHAHTRTLSGQPPTVILSRRSTCRFVSTRTHTHAHARTRTNTHAQTQNIHTSGFLLLTSGAPLPVPGVHNLRAAAQLVREPVSLRHLHEAVQEGLLRHL